MGKLSEQECERRERREGEEDMSACGVGWVVKLKQNKNRRRLTCECEECALGK